MSSCEAYQALDVGKIGADSLGCTGLSQRNAYKVAFHAVLVVERRVGERALVGASLSRVYGWGIGQAPPGLSEQCGNELPISIYHSYPRRCYALQRS